MSIHLASDAVLLRQLDDARTAYRVAAAKVRTIEAALKARGIHVGSNAEHGTDGGYYAHRRRWLTPPCQPCRAAHARAERERAARREVAA